MMQITGFGFVLVHVVGHKVRDEDDGSYFTTYRAFHHELDQKTANLKNQFFLDIRHNASCHKQGYDSIISIWLPPVLMFKNFGLEIKELEDHVGMFTDSTELQDEKFIGAHNEK